MSDALETAAAAFERDIGGSSGPAPNSGIRDRQTAPEPIFGNSDAHEGDIPTGGGDDELAPGEKPARKARRPEPEEDDNEFYEDPELDDDEEVADGDDEGEADDEAGEGEEEDDELLDRTFKVMVDGEEEEITLREAIDSGIRTKTFHKRLNQLDQVRKELGTHAERIIADRQRTDEILGEAEEILTGILPAEPDWDALFKEDPKAARELQKQYDSYKGKIAEIREKRLTAQKEQAEKEAREQAEYAQAEFPKFAAFAKWRDRESMQKDIKSMRKSALSVGFSEEEVSRVFDHRMLAVLLKASKYDRMMAAKPKAVRTTKTPVSPGAGSKSTARRGIIGAQKKLARTGSIEDAQDVFAKIIR